MVGNRMIIFNEFIDQMKSIKAKEKIALSVIACLMLVVIAQAFVNISLAKNITVRVSLPPDLEFGAVIDTNKIDSFEIYSFAGLITQQLNLWKNGKEDFAKNINKFTAYITPEYRSYLLKKYNNLLKLGELDGREKSMQPINIYKKSNVVKIADGWLVTVDFKQQEHLGNTRFKHFNVRYAIKVVFRDIDTETNPWGLQIDRPLSEPLRLIDNG